MRKAKPTKEHPGKCGRPSAEMVERLVGLPLGSPRKGNAGLVLAKDGKRALAEIAWPNDANRQARFVKAGSREPYRLSREEYLQLASAESYRMNDELINGLLTAWAVRAMKRQAELGKHPERVLRVIAVARFVEFLLGHAKEARQPSAGEPQEIARRHLLSENWRLTIELQGLEDKLEARHERGTWTTKKNAAVKWDALRVRILAAAQRVSPLLREPESKWVGQILVEPEAKDENWKRAVIRRALATSGAYWAVQRLLAESEAKP